MKKCIVLILCMVLGSVAFAQKKKIILTTSYGKIEIMLFDKTPKHRDNMLKLVRQKFYDSILFHRIIPAFVIQGGDPRSKHAKPGVMLGEGDVGYKIPAEINDAYYHRRGAVGMAREENPEKASSGCQFYIVVGKKVTDETLDKLAMNNGHTFTKEQREVYKTEGGTPHLDGRYTVFGMVIKGMDVVDTISKLPRDGNDRPNQDVVMKSVRIKKKFWIF